MNRGLRYAPMVIRHPHRPGRFLAQFTGEGIGTKFVRDPDGAPTVFDDEDSAMRAALAALLSALNSSRADVTGKTFVVRSPRTKSHAALIQEVFSTRR